MNRKFHVVICGPLGSAFRKASWALSPRPVSIDPTFSGGSGNINFYLQLRLLKCWQPVFLSRPHILKLVMWFSSGNISRNYCKHWGESSGRSRICSPCRGVGVRCAFFIYWPDRKVVWRWTQLELHWKSLGMWLFLFLKREAYHSTDGAEDCRQSWEPRKLQSGSLVLPESTLAQWDVWSNAESDVAFRDRFKNRGEGLERWLRG